MAEMKNEGAGVLVLALAEIIIENKAYLSEIDGKIGDGDHGVNMAKGFARAAGKLDGSEALDTAFSTLSDILMNDIGGSMGPLYGLMFSGMAEAIEGHDAIDQDLFATMLESGLTEVQEIGAAGLGDKTLLDAYIPALEAYKDALKANKSLLDALDALCVAAEKGRDSTIDMVAKVGRSARLGERSRGVLDAGATSCAMILCTLANGFKNRAAQ